MALDLFGPAWRQRLLPAAFRGAFFRWATHELEGGRRLALFEFPLREEPFVEDLGRGARRYSLTGYVIGPDYFTDRDTLVAALELGGEGTLQHPYLGLITVQVQSYRLREDQQNGGLALFEMVFLESGAAPSPVALPDTASGVLGGASDLLGAVAAAFAGVYQVAMLPDFIEAAAVELLTGFAEVFAPLLATPNADLAGVALQQADLAQQGATVVLEPTVIVADVQGCLTGFAAAVTEPNPDRATASAFVSATSGPVTIGAAAPAALEPSSRDLPPGVAYGRDPTFGLAAFGSYGAALPPIDATTTDRGIQADNQTGFLQLVRVSAAAAVAQIYAETEFQSAGDAEQARDQLTELLDGLALAAADQGQDALYGAIEQLSALVTADLTRRAAQLPDLIEYRYAASLPSLVLAERLYQDATRANELVARNDVPHPAFMPRAGEALAA